MQADDYQDQSKQLEKQSADLEQQYQLTLISYGHIRNENKQIKDRLAQL